MISIIVPVYNDPSGVAITLDSLLEQSTGLMHQIHVVDNNSSDNTSEVVRSYDTDRILLHQESEFQSSYAARNKGIHESEGEIISFVDSDITVPSDWLTTAFNELEASGADYMGCNVVLRQPETPSFISSFDAHTGFPVRKYIDNQGFAPTCCLFVRRTVFEDVGYFDHRLTSGGDKEFGNRVSDAGYKLHFAEHVTMYHPTRNSLIELSRKDIRVGRGHYQLQRYHSDRYGTPGIPPRPSGIRRADQDYLSLADRISFSALSTILTALRGFGYYQAYITDYICGYK